MTVAERNRWVAHRAKRSARVSDQAQRREARWQNHRFAVPYRTDGPRVSLGILWFASIVAATLFRPELTVIPAAIAAMAAGFQTSHGWVVDPSARDTQDKIAAGLVADPVRFLSAAFALLVAAGGLGSVFALGLACVVCTLLALLAAVWFGADRGFHGVVAIGEVIIRSSIPAGLAAGSIVILAIEEPRAFLALVGLISAYEMADFMVGTGAANPIEGPVAGLAALAVVAFALRLVPPDPLTAESLPAFAVLAGLAAVVGQLVASALLPRGGVYAPGLRRLDSYLLAAPFWMLLL